MQEHVHEPSHEHMSGEELIALISYMVSHNHHHAEELNDLASNASGPAKEAIAQAIRSFEEGNRHLEKALQLMQKASPCQNPLNG